MRVFLVPHVWVTHRHAAHQTAQTDSRRPGGHPAVDRQRSPGQPLEGGAGPGPADRQALPGKPEAVLL